MGKALIAFPGGRPGRTTHTHPTQTQARRRVQRNVARTRFRDSWGGTWSQWPPLPLPFNPTGVSCSTRFIYSIRVLYPDPPHTPTFTPRTQGKDKGRAATTRRQPLEPPQAQPRPSSHSKHLPPSPISLKGGGVLHLHAPTPKAPTPKARLLRGHSGGVN